jgi:lysophospholipase L1-like esterase
MANAGKKPFRAANISITGEWRIQVEYAGKTAVFEIDAPEIVKVENEIMDRLPVFNPRTAGYARGIGLKGVKAQECSVSGALIPGSLIVRGKDNATRVYIRGTDYEFDESWGTVGRLEGGAIGADTPVSVDYLYGLMRIDEIMVKKGKLVLNRGVPHVANPGFTLSASKKEPVIARIWVTPLSGRLTDENLFPVLERTYPNPAKTRPSVAEQRIPATIAKLKNGGKVRIMAWGDSVTEGSYLQNPGERWQEQFVAWLRRQYSKAEIELITEAWGGRSTDSYRNEPPGSPHNYREKVLDPQPDLIISEFVNDARLDEQAVREKYGRILSEFRETGAEWIILTPHYVRPDWMELDRAKDINDDPRPYVKALRTFAAENSLALADASLRWGRLWCMGIPYPVLMKNNINHPDVFGQSLFVEALRQLFP